MTTKILLSTVVLLAVPLTVVTPVVVLPQPLLLVVVAVVTVVLPVRNQVTVLQVSHVLPGLPVKESAGVAHVVVVEMMTLMLTLRVVSMTVMVNLSLV